MSPHTSLTDLAYPSRPVTDHCYVVYTCTSELTAQRWNDGSKIWPITLVSYIRLHGRVFHLAFFQSVPLIALFCNTSRCPPFCHLVNRILGITNPALVNLRSIRAGVYANRSFVKLLIPLPLPLAVIYPYSRDVSSTCGSMFLRGPSSASCVSVLPSAVVPPSTMRILLGSRLCNIREQCLLNSSS